MRLGAGKQTGYQVTEVSLPFAIKRDESVYVGELKWSQTQHESGWLKIIHPDPASFSISDRAVRDVPVIQERYPDLAGRPLRIEIPGRP
jgi:hypothetical protein